jgi:hypothetical protein
MKSRVKWLVVVLRGRLAAPLAPDPSSRRFLPTMRYRIGGVVYAPEDQRGLGHHRCGSSDLESVARIKGTVAAAAAAVAVAAAAARGGPKSRDIDP